MRTCKSFTCFDLLFIRCVIGIEIYSLHLGLAHTIPKTFFLGYEMLCLSSQLQTQGTHTTDRQLVQLKFLLIKMHGGN